MTSPESLYIHIPFCISKCKYCDFFSVAGGENGIPDSYISALCNEIKYRLHKYSVKRLQTIYIGGGTPSLLSALQLKAIVDTITTACSLSDSLEFTVEANPDDVNEDFVKMLEQCGVTRISCGIQSFNQDALKFVSRRADLKNNLNALEILKSWNGDVSVDIICGLPFETEESFLFGIEKLISYHPDHISMYSLTIEGETPLGKMFDSGELQIDFDLSDKMWLSGKKILEENGYKMYEVSNFAKNGMECKHNLKYWNHQDYIGCGSGATGTVYSGAEGYRWSNLNDICCYCDFWNGELKNEKKIPCNVENIDCKTSEFEFFMMGLRKIEGVYSSDFYKIFNKPIPESIVGNFKKWELNGLSKITELEDDINYTLGEKGILFLNKFLEEII